MKRILTVFTLIFAFVANVYAEELPKMFAHRGCWSRIVPENSIPAIESVIRMGVDIVEIDLKMTKDSVLVLSHDKTIDRTLNGKGLLSSGFDHFVS